MALRKPKRSISPGLSEPSTSKLAVTTNGFKNSVSEVDAGNGNWTTVTGSSRKKQKKEKKKQSHMQEIDEAVVKDEIATPLFQFDPAGFVGHQVGVAEVRDFILNILVKESHPRWVKISNKRAIRGVVCVLAQGIEPSTLALPGEITNTLPQPLNPNTTSSGSRLPVFQRLFSHYCPTRAPGDSKRLHSVVQTLLNAPIPESEKSKRSKARTATTNSTGGDDPAPYLLPMEMFLENGYILPTYGFDVSARIGGKSKCKSEGANVPFANWRRDDNLIETPQLLQSDDAAPPLLKILGIDCEMCVTTAGSELCRISVVDSSGRVIYNTLVKPCNKVVDYATIYSGITEESLASVVTTLQNVQEKLSELIDYNTVLVGHSLNCDLLVLKLAHPWVIDTSVIYQHTRGPPYKASLKWLAGKWLNKEIQKPGKAGGVETIGHNSEEDAKAAIELVKLKMEKGPTFGEFATDQESIFERLERAELPRTTCIVDHGNPGQWHGAKASVAIACTTDEEIVKGVIDNVQNHNFVFARMMDLSHALGWSQPSNSVLDKRSTVENKTIGNKSPLTTPDASVVSANGDMAHAYHAMDRRLEAIHRALPTNTAFVVLSGHNDPRTVMALTAKKNRFDVLFRTGKPVSMMTLEEKWMEEDDRALTSAVAKVREGMTFLSIKR